MQKTQLMGILNVTPDSFFAPSRANTLHLAIETALRLQAEGADLIDIGGESTRPGADIVSEAEEIDRIAPLFKSLKGQLKVPLSIDTYKPAVASLALQAGASLLNDITGFEQPAMVDLAKEYGVDICVMHMRGAPQTMQNQPTYPEGIANFLFNWFENKIESLIKAGINPTKIILDPGIGFGKTVADNLEIIHNLARFKSLGFRILLGVSRKSFLTKILNTPPSELMAPTIAFNTLAICSKVDIIRVHDVKEHRAVIDALHAYRDHLNA